MINATQIRPGMIIVYEGDLYRVSSVHHLTPGNKRGFMQTKMKNLKTGVGTERKFRSEDRLEQAMLETRMMQYLYHEGDLHTFMDTENYEQTSLAAEEIGDLLFYLLPNQVVEIEFFEGKPVGISPPSTVDLEVVETEPSLKGATASSSYKPAKLETGITIQVPPFVQVRDRVRVDPSEGKYLERIK
ncbi:MAG: elongation factor P [Deltaproteobacteria bacterium RBG_16_55_12]|nr:MAG: elongation factor P [Deltaproteobacteria bacterium RBG_16_55_12]OGQ64292.1 MAG: elongation factor P [Deltaproteobacteria bacterium RIFCSPLOWO2_12_55_13]